MTTLEKIEQLIQTWRWPLILAAFSCHAFAAALLAPSIHEKWAWFSLAAPTFILSFCWRSRFIRRRLQQLSHSGSSAFKSPW